jgi:hypothetical protein
MYESGVPGWMVALALAIVFSTAVAVVAITTGLVAALLPALAIVAAGYGLYLVIAARRRRGRFNIAEPWRSMIDDRAARRRLMRRYRGVP